jgi:ribose transport system substrate-binding protein
MVAKIPFTRKRLVVSFATVFAVLVTACAPAAQPVATSAPAAAKPTTAPAAPTAPAPAAKPTEAAKPAAAAAKTTKAKGDIRVGFVVGSLDNPYWVTAKDAAEAEAKKQGIQITVLGIPKETDIDKQIAIVEDLITQKVDALMLAPAGSKEIVPAVEQANKAGIPVICIDKCAEGGEIITLIATDNVKGARLGSEYVAKSIGNKGKVAILEGVQASQPGRERLQGAKEGFGQFKDIQIVASQPGEWRQDKGQSATENILTAQPDLVGIFASNDQMALGALQAIAAAGKADTVKIVGYDAIDPALQAVKDGKMSATVAQFPAKMAELGVQTVMQVLMEGKRDFPKFIDSGVDVVDKSNVDKYLKK